MRLVASFVSIAQEILNQADRNARARDAEIRAEKTAGADASSGTFPGSSTKYGRFGKSTFAVFYLH